LTFKIVAKDGSASLGKHLESIPIQNFGLIYKHVYVRIEGTDDDKNNRSACLHLFRLASRFQFSRHSRNTSSSPCMHTDE